MENSRSASAAKSPLQRKSTTEARSNTAQKAKKTRRPTTGANASSAAKAAGMGKLQTFQIKEREREYLRKSKEMEQKIQAASHQPKVLQVLLKQKAELQDEYSEVVALRESNGRTAKKRRQSAHTGTAKR